MVTKEDWEQVRKRKKNAMVVWVVVGIIGIIFLSLSANLSWFTLALNNLVFALVLSVVVALMFYSGIDKELEKDYEEVTGKKW